MTHDLTQSRDRLPGGFLEQSLFASELGMNSQVIEDEKLQGNTITLRGETLYNFGLCSYLGLSDDPRLVESAIDAIRRYGNSYSSSAAYTSVPLYNDLKERLSLMVGAPVLVAGTTTLAHHAALPVLIGSGDLVLVDEFAHASLLNVLPTLKSRRASIERVKHNDLDHVASRASAARRRVWYLIDGVYSVHGDLAPARDITNLLDTYDSLWVYSDDAHGFGWSGLRGRGPFLDSSGWHPHLVMAYGLSKSFAALGGVVAAKDPGLIRSIELTGGPMVFGGPVPPASLGAGIASADIHLSDELPVLQADLAARIDFVNDYAGQIGLPLTAREHTPLWFMQVGSSNTSVSVGARVVRDGYYVNVAVYPVVKKGKSGIRFTVTRYNSMSEIRGFLDSLNAARLSYEPGDDILDLTLFE
jgi:7-keto-8-aminopelargonate synthetase-like enzyme